MMNSQTDLQQKLELYLEMKKGLVQKANRVSSVGKTILAVSLPVVSYLPAAAQCQGSQASGLALPQSSTGLAIDVDGDGTDDFKIFDNASAAKQATLNIQALNGGQVLTSGGSGSVQKFAMSGAINHNNYNQYSGLWWLANPQSAGGNWFDNYPNTGYIGVKQGANYGFIQLTINSGPTPGSLYDPYNITVSEAGLSNTGGSAVGAGVCASLPVELVFFDVKPEPNGLTLTWATASEVNNAGFEVQRSDDGQLFTSLSFIESKKKEGEASYVFADVKVRKGRKYFYRLKQLDFNGQYQYSDIVSAEQIYEGPTVRFTPNPIEKGNATFEYSASEEGKLEVEVFNLEGKLKRTQSQAVVVGANVLSLDFSEFPSGIYFVKLRQGEYVSYSQIVVQ